MEYAYKSAVEEFASEDIAPVKNINGNAKFALVKIEKANNYTKEQKENIKKAYRLFKEGYNQDYIWRETSVKINDKKGIMYSNDLSFKDNVDLSSVKDGVYKVEDLLDGELAVNYPYIKNMPLEITNLREEVIKSGTKNNEYIELVSSVEGGADGINSITLNSLYLNNHKNEKNLKKKIEGVLSHELQHTIQTLENGELKETAYFYLDENDNIIYTEGDKKTSSIRYRNNPQEIEAEVTRIQNAMDKDDVKKFPLDLIFNEVKNHYEKTTKEINPTAFIKKLNEKYGNYSDYWYNDVKNGETNNGLDTYQYTYERNFAKLQKDKKSSQVTNSNGTGTSRTISTTGSSKIFAGKETNESIRGTRAESNNTDDRSTLIPIIDRGNYRYSVSSDNQGRKLSTQQQEYFKD